MNVPTYSEILNRLLNSVDNALDKREGSVIYNALAPPAFEIYNLYSAINMIENNSFADTADYTYLQKRAKERGIYPKPATRLVIVGCFNIVIDIGARFTSQTSQLSFVVSEEYLNPISDNKFYYKMYCEVYGNKTVGIGEDLIPTSTVTGLEKATIYRMMIAGQDSEDVEAFRTRYFNNITNQSYGGNIADYTSWVMSIDGVAGVRVYPVFNGPGTVKLLINGTEELASTVKNAIDPTDNEGRGLGLAPIGHTVTVTTPTYVNANIKITGLQAEAGYETADFSSFINAKLTAYFDELVSDWFGSTDEEEHIKLYTSKLYAEILSIEHIENVDKIAFIINDVEYDTIYECVIDSVPVVKGSPIVEVQ